jgi:hypothetical protein
MSQTLGLLYGNEQHNNKSSEMVKEGEVEAGDTFTHVGMMEELNFDKRCVVPQKGKR